MSASNSNVGNERSDNNGLPDLLSGSIWDKMLKFAMPLIAASVLQQLFNATDVAVVGRFAGKLAMAAVGSNAPLIGLLINLFLGLALGSNVVIARFIGERNNSKVHSAVNTTLIIALIGGIVIMCAGIAITPTVLAIIEVPLKVRTLAILYLRIFFLGMPFFVIYNFESAIFRSKGNTRTPLYCLTFSGLLNVILNLFFVIKLEMGVAGVATATVMANMVSCGLLFYFLKRDKFPFGVRAKTLRMDKAILINIMKIGLPSGVQGMLFSFSNLVIQSAINSLGADTMAGSAISFYFELTAFFVLSAFSQAITTFISQSYGAGNLKRCRDVVKTGVVMNILFTVSVSGLFLLLDKNILGLFNSDPQVLALAHARLLIILSAQGINCTNESMSAALRGLGNSLVPAIISLLCICGVRILWVYTGFRHFHTLKALLLCYPLSWSLSLALMTLVYLRVRKEKLCLSSSLTCT